MSFRLRCFSVGFMRQPSSFVHIGRIFVLSLLTRQAKGILLRRLVRRDLGLLDGDQRYRVSLHCPRLRLWHEALEMQKQVVGEMSA